MNDRVLAGDPGDMRWLPEGVARFPEEIRRRGAVAGENEPAIEPEIVADDSLPDAVSPKKLPKIPLEAPLVEHEPTEILPETTPAQQ